jgi:hypothetical protein
MALCPEGLAQSCAGADDWQGGLKWTPFVGPGGFEIKV